MKLIGNKVALVFLIINIALIAIGYFGVMNSAGFLNALIPTSDLTTGTPDEYWTAKKDYYFSIIFVAFFVINYLVILLYRGQGEIMKKVSAALIIQLIITSIISLIKIFIIEGYNKTSIEEFKDSTFDIYYVIVAVISAIIVYNFNFKNKVGFIAVTCACLLVSFILNIENNILRVDLANKSAIVMSKLKPVGSPIMIHKVTLFGSESYQDGVSTLDKLTDNQTNYMDLLIYAGTNKPSNQEIFIMAEKSYANHIHYDETYLKEKMGDDFNMTRLAINNKINNRYKENDMIIIDIYKNQGVDAALKELEASRKESWIRSLISAARTEPKNSDDKEFVNN